MSNSSPSSSQPAHKRSHDGDDSSDAKRPHLMLPQIPNNETDDLCLMADHATLYKLMEIPYDLGPVEHLSDQHAADILWAVAAFKSNNHSDWDVKVKTSENERVAYFSRATSITGPGLRDALREAWNSRTFKHIRNATFLQRAYVEPQDIKPMQNQRVTERAVRNAWRTPYVTDRLDFLYDLALKMKQNTWAQNDRQAYANTVAMVQSSGTGKSRMADETARLVFTLPFNLRSDLESRALAYPLPDPAVRGYMCNISSEDKLRIRYHSFFGCLFELAKEELETLYKGPKIPQRQLATLWRDHLEKEGIRDRFYARLVAKSEEMVMRQPLNENPITSMADSAIIHMREFGRTLASKVEDLTNTVNVLLYFDEAHQLTQSRCVESTKNLYKVLLSVLSDYTDIPLFVVFLSTTSYIGDFAPPRGIEDSDRATESGAHQAPITETPFDCDPNILVKQGVHDRKAVADVRFMARFGRPYFWTYMDQITEIEQNRTINSFLGTLRSKLIHETQYEKPLEACDRVGRLAVADVRLCLQYEPHVEGNKALDTQARLIASHMRFAYSVPIHRQYFRSGYPSEPMLAEAAAQQLHHWRKVKRTALLDILVEHMGSGLLDRGERGEVVARMLVTEAYDRAVAETTHPPLTPDVQSRLFSLGCRLLDWIRKFFSSDRAQKIFQSHPANCGGRTFEDVFKDAWIRFTHFAKSADDHILNTHSMFAAFVRGMAYTCRNGQSFIDFIIPVLLYDEKIGSWVMTAIFIQVKRRTRAGNYMIDAEALGFFHPEPTDKFPDGDHRPYITIVMDLGVQSTVPTYAKPAAQNVIQRSRTPTGRQHVSQVSAVYPQTREPPASPSKFRISSQPEKSLHPPNVSHPRYAIYVSGCSDTNYGVIDESDRETYKQLLRINEFLYEHPRPETIPRVMAQKPFFALGSNSYSWAESDVLNARNPADADDKEDEDETFHISVHPDNSPDSD